ncbi:MAG TPA: prepilin-type N-terminal cleavage/methylation domain-containing protein, partial [Thermoanaerobaculia bacterium]
MTTTHHVRRSERGFSLAEILTATAIFAVIFIAALMVYDRSNRVYKQGVEASDVQQGTRVAFDKLVAELRMVGFDYDRDGSPLSSLASPWRPNTPYSIGNLVQPDPPNGHTYMCIVAGTSAPVAFTEWETGDGSMTVEPAPSTVRWQEVGSVTYQQPDEQVEFAGPSALVIRANFDYDWETGTCDTTDLTAPCQNGRERSLESASFPVVTTDNDEIVGYALKPTSGTGPDTLTFYADLTRPRTVHPGTGDEELPITIDNVDLCSGGCNNPPYTLYRFTFDEDGNAIETPIADNIRSMNFRYFTDAAATAANEIATADLPDGEGPYNGAEPDADVPERALRADVRSIRIALVGMNPQLDPAYNDPSDAIAPKYRKYTLETLIVPRNIGRHGMREFASTAPSAPTLRTVCAGSCNAVYLVWTPPLTGGDVETYNILYSPMGATPVANACETAGYVYAEDAGRNLDGYAGIFITPGQVYKFAIQSVNKYGSATSGCVAIHVENSTRPLAPTDLDATNDVDPAYPAVANQVNLKWPRVNQNDPAKLTTTCSDATSRAQASMPSAERRHFVMWKSKDEMFTPGDAGSSVVVDSTTLPQPMTLDEFVTWADPATANCTPYFYRIQTIDYCNTNAAWNQGGDASVGASTGFYPPVGSAATRGRPFEDQTPPAAPPSFALVSDTCAGGFCDFVLRWSAVTRDDGAAPTDPDIYIENYDIRVEQKANVDPLDTTYTLVTSKTITDGGLEARFDDLAEPTLVQPYRFIVRARDCINGVDSTPVRYPCLFGNDPTA